MEMQINTIVRYHYPSTRMAKMEKTMLSVDKDTEQPGF